MIGRQWLIRLLLPLLVLALLLLASKSWLSLPARSIQVHPEAAFQPSAAVTLGGYQSESRLKEWQNRFPSLKVLALEPPNRWTQEAGLRPTMRVITDYLLQKRGFQPQNIPRILLEKEYGWHPLLALGTWLESPGNETEKLLVVLDPTRLDYFQVGASAVLSLPTRARLRFDTLDHPDLGPGNWWRNRSGWKDVATGWFLGSYALLAGEGEAPYRYNPLDENGRPYWQPANPLEWVP